MPATPQPAFTVDACTSMGATGTSSNVLLPGTPASDTVVRVTNLGPDPAAIQLGTSNAVTATNNQSAVVPAGQTAYFAIGSNTYLAAIAIATKAILNICTGN